MTVSLQLKWVKAHIGISGNEQADTLAKEGGTLDNINYLTPTPPCYIKGIIKEHCNCATTSGIKNGKIIQWLG